MHRSILIPLALTLTLACTTDPGSDDEAGTTTSPSTTDADESTSDETSDGESTLGTSSSSSTSESDDMLFVSSDAGEDGVWCDPFEQDCLEGEKCVPYASSGDTWDALKCVQIQGDQAAGEACMYANASDSYDDCDGTSWCWNVDQNGEGVCHPFCTGTPDMPECPPMSQCTISGSGVINICIPTCDPTLQNCSDGTACYWTNVDFSCIVTTQDIPTGEPCGFINDCASGNMCVDAASLPECNGPSCCANFCDLEVGDSQCAGSPGTACVGFFDVGETPPGYEHIGVCILPD